MVKSLKEKENLSNSAHAKEKFERAERLKYIRSQLRYSIRKFAAIHNIPYTTLYDWENAKEGGLTRKGAEILINAFQKEGINCTFDWLYYGKGSDPTLPFRKDLLSSFQSTVPGNTIIQELNFFNQLHPSAIDTIVSDNSMEPYFNQGTYVAGERLYEKDIDTIIRENCILQLQTGEVLVRKLLAGNKQGCYSLMATNSKAADTNKAIINVKLLSAARIIWTRKK